MSSPSQPLSDPHPAELTGGRPLVRRYSGVVRLTHWLNAVFLVGMVASGLQIYNAYPHFGPRGNVYPLPNPLDGTPSPEWARLGGCHVGSLKRAFYLA